MNDVQDLLMARYCPSFKTDAGMPLATMPNRNAEVLDVECTAIATNSNPDFAMLAQKIDAQNNFVSQGFEHLIKQNQSFDSRLAALEQRQPAQPIVQYQPQQQVDLMPIVQAQNQGFAMLAYQNQQNQLAMFQMASAMQKIAERPATINHFVDNSVCNETHSVEIHGNNYGNINIDGDQRNGSFWGVLLGGIIILIVGSQIYGK